MPGMALGGIQEDFPEEVTSWVPKGSRQGFDGLGVGEVEGEKHARGREQPQGHRCVHLPAVREDEDIKGQAARVLKAKMEPVLPSNGNERTQ